MNELERRARQENKAIVQYTKTVRSTEEHDALVEKIKAQGGEIISTRSVTGKDNAISIEYRVLED